jgi:two-component system, NarL family, nitrate/nitrite response regulator NarL
MARTLSHDTESPEAVAHAAPDAVAVRIAIADESPIFRDGLRHLLEADPRLHMVGHTSVGSMLLTLLGDARPDVLLLGPACSGSPWVDTLQAITDAGLSLRIILLAPAIDMPEVTAALRSGAVGVLAKDSAPELLFQSIAAVMAGHYWVGAERASRGVAASVRRLDHARRHALGFGLTRRELDIIRAVLDGDTNREIAARLTISENTVKRHLMHIFNKMGVSTRVELALFATHHRLLEGI